MPSNQSELYGHDKGDMINVVIVEDRKDIRESLRSLINSDVGFSCRYIFGSAEEALTHIPELHLDVVLMDINLPGMSGIDCVKILKQSCPRVQFMMMTVYEDDEKIF